MPAAYQSFKKIVTEICNSQRGAAATATKSNQRLIIPLFVISDFTHRIVLFVLALIKYKVSTGDIIYFLCLLTFVLFFQFDLILIITESFPENNSYIHKTTNCATLLLDNFKLRRTLKCSPVISKCIRTQ